MKILIIEKSQNIANKVKRLLSKSYVADVARSGKEGLAKAQSVDYKTIILGSRLADMPGRQVCKLLRRESITTPILIMTTDDNIDECVTLLDEGADDFVLHSVQPKEFTARLRALLRRSTRQYGSDVTVLKDLKLDSNRRRVERAGRLIPLRRKEFDILEYLIHNRGRVVTRSMILNHVWDDSKEHWHNTVDVHIKYLRDKIDRPFPTPLIKTAYGIGYIVDDSP